jgi:hypothetical protein
MNERSFFGGSRGGELQTHLNTVLKSSLKPESLFGVQKILHGFGIITKND